MHDDDAASMGEILGGLVPQMILALAGLLVGWALLNVMMGVPLEVTGRGGALGLRGPVNLVPFTIFASLFVLLSGLAAAEPGRSRVVTWVPFGAGRWLVSTLRDVAGDETVPTNKVVALVVMLIVIDVLLSRYARRRRAAC